MGKRTNRGKDKMASVGALFRQGRNAMREGNYDSAIEAWGQARDQTPEEGRENWDKRLAEAHFRRGLRKLTTDPESAAQDLIKAAQTVPGDALYAYHAGLIHHRMRALDEAIGWYRRALRYDPNFTRANYPLVIALIESGESIESIAAREPSWDFLTDEQRALLQREPATPLTSGMVHAEAGEWEQAEDAFLEALEGSLPPRAEGLAHYYIGVSAEHDDEHLDAIEEWDQALEAGLNLPRIHDNIVLALTLQAEAEMVTESFDAALDTALTGLEIDPDNTRLQDIEAHARLALGFRAANAGVWEEALDHWAAAQNPTGAVARDLAANIAIAYEKLGWPQEAAESWREFARRRPRNEGSEGWLSPEQVARLWSRISVLYMQTGLPEEAINTLQNALNYQPGDPVLLLALASAYADDERYEAAHNRVDEVLEKDPDNIDALVMRAELSEVAPRGYGYFFTGRAGVREWEAVLATGDKEYAPLARQNLIRLYEDSIHRSMAWRHLDEALEVAEKALELQPDHNAIRANYVAILHLIDAPEEKIEAEIARIDLSDQDALLLLIKFWLIVEEHDRIESFLKEIGPQDAEFYLEIGAFFIDRNYDDIAQTYFDKALNSVPKSDRKGIRADIGLQYAIAEREDEAARIWRSILEDDRSFGPAHFLLARWEHKRGNERAALRHLRQAESWALQNDDMKLMEGVKKHRLIIRNPLSGILADMPLGDMTPEEILETMQEAGIDEDFFIDLLDEMDDQPHRRERPSARARRNRKGRGRGNWHGDQEDEE